MRKIPPQLLLDRLLPGEYTALFWSTALSTLGIPIYLILALKRVHQPPWLACFLRTAVLSTVYAVLVFVVVAASFLWVMASLD